nr:T9SS type A sorting domain-containing protein [Flavobacteriales bacterium]
MKSPGTKMTLSTKKNMLKYILISYILLSGSILMGQVYFKNNTKYYYEKPAHPETPPGTWIVDKMLLDSAIGGQRYYTVYSKTYIYNRQYNEYTKYLSIAQDSNRVYGKYWEDTTFRLMYDFSKGKGDSLESFMYSSYLRVIYIDSVSLDSTMGIKRRVLHVTTKYGNYNYKIIEGIGAIGLPERTPGLVLVPFWGLAEADKSCKTICINDTLAYNSPTGEVKDCYWDTTLSIDNIYELKNITLHPNPASSKVELIYRKNKSLDLRLYDSNGLLIKSCKISKNMTLDLESLTNGIYLLCFINSESGLIETHRLFIIH